MTHGCAQKWFQGISKRMIAQSIAKALHVEGPRFLSLVTVGWENIPLCQRSWKAIARWTKLGSVIGWVSKQMACFIQRYIVKAICTQGKKRKVPLSPDVISACPAENNSQAWGRGVGGIKWQRAALAGGCRSTWETLPAKHSWQIHLWDWI